jgi:putative transposase
MSWRAGLPRHQPRHGRSAGTGALYGSRFKSFAVREDEHFLKVCRYVERNPVRAGLVDRAEQWPWGSLCKRDPACTHKPGADQLLDAWPVHRRRGWIDWVNQPESPEELAAVRTCVRRERPYGDEPWARAVAQRLGSVQSLQPPGRPKTVIRSSI